MFNEFSEAIASGSLNDIVGSTIGMIILLVFSAVLLIGTLVVTGGQEAGKSKTKALAYSGVAVAIAMVLSQFKVIDMPKGGSVTPFSMLFVVIIGYFFGAKQGILTGIVYGLLQLAFGGYVEHPVQLLLDYPIAFGALGLSGLFSKSSNGLIKGMIVGVAGRFLFHFISGVVFFAVYAPEGWNPIVYSLWYNFSYIGVEAAITIILLLVPGVMTAFNTVKKTAIA